MRPRVTINPGVVGMLIIVLARTAAVAAPPPGPVIHTEDVTRFYRLYDAAKGHPTAEELERDYLAPGTQGLHQFVALRKLTAAAISDAIAKQPATYADARRCLAVLPGVTRRLTAALDKLAALYPEAKFPPVTVFVGRGKPAGATNPSGVFIGLEALCGASFMNPNLEDRFVHTIAHEYGHIQQPSELQLLTPGDPGATVLRLSLIEGVGEFAAELISGDVANYQHKAWTKGHEAAIEAAFVADEDSTDVSHWLYNGPGSADKPSDLGYWVGYRIARSYYQRATDKHRALQDLFEMRDPKAFVARSGWRPSAPSAGATPPGH